MGVTAETGLMTFLNPTAEPLKVLVVESSVYLPVLRQMMPEAEIFSVVADEDVCQLPEYQGLEVNWTVCNYLEEKLPLEEDYFDYLISERCLELAGNPQDIASGLGKYLKDTGYFLTSFQNIRYWKVLKRLMGGNYIHVVSRLFTKADFTRLLAASFYKDVEYAPKKHYAPEGFVESLTRAGFENFDDDLEVEVWMAKAAKSTPEILALKQFYTPEVRRELVTYLRRIEYGIDLKDNVQALRELMQQQGIFSAYLADFIQQTVFFYERFLQNIISELDAEGASDMADGLMKDMAERAIYRSQYDCVMELSARLQRELPAGLRPENISDSDPYIDSAGHDHGPAELPELKEDMQLVRDALNVEGLPPERRIAFISCVNNEDWYSECQLYIKNLYIPKGMGAELIAIRGASSMTSGYNAGMRQSDAKYKVYVHQDCFITYKYFIPELLKLFENEKIGIAGTIGSRKLPATGIWWDGMRVYGRILHACEAESIVDSEVEQVDFGYIDVEAVDGLMMATQYDVPWREDLFTGWHFYDVSQCKELQRRGFITVVPHQRDFWCIHCPKEKPLDPSYKVYNKIFLKEYGAELDPEI